MKDLQKKLRPSAGAAVWSHFYHWLFIIAVGVLGLVGCIAMIADDEIAGTVLVLAVLILLEVLMFLSWRKHARNTKEANARKAKRLDALTKFDLERLEDEISNGELRFKTFYLLNDYLYIPSQGLLIGYEDIGGWKTVRHSTNGVPDGAWVELTEPDGFLHKITVRQWRRYLMSLDEFVPQLNERRERRMQQMALRDGGGL